MRSHSGRVQLSHEHIYTSADYLYKRVTMSRDNRVICLSDNIAPSGSGYWAEHGISFYIEHNDIRVLFDTGQSGDVVTHNAREAGLDLKGINAIVLSHGHYDHTGGMLKVLNITGATMVIAHPDAFDRKVSLKDNGFRDISIPFNSHEIRQCCNVLLETGPVKLGSGLYTTGEIERITPYETPQHDLMVERNGSFFTDSLMDDQSLVIESDDGVILLCGCCHAGVVNTIDHVRRTFGAYPDIIAGGLHTEKASAERLEDTVVALRDAGVKKIIAGHCTGEKMLGGLSRSGIDTSRLASGMRII